MGGGSASFNLGATGDSVGKQNDPLSQTCQTFCPRTQWMPSYISRDISNEMARDQIDPTCKEGIAPVVDFNW